MSLYAANQQARKKGGGNEPWRSKERHYCAACNVWMGHDKQSIALHENGKKHREAVEADLVRRRDGKARKEKAQKELESVFAKINAAVGVTAGSSSVSNFPPVPQQVASSLQPVKQEATSHTTNNNTKYAADNAASSSISAIPSSYVLSNNPKPVFDPNVGHYNSDGTTYLEGQVYAHILEEGMPIQLWIGSVLATNTEKCDLCNTSQWKMALLAKVVRKRRVKDEEAGEEEDDCDSNKNNNNNNNSKVSCHVSYLKTPNDDDETIETNVQPSRIRLILGSDPTLPSTLEEAHLSLLGGKQVIKLNKNNAEDTTTTIDENTGLSSWTTTEITKVTVQYEKNQEKKRKRQHEQELSDYQAKKEYELQARKMEEAKYDNAHDSALGAYDVWSNAEDIAVENKIRTYKGVDITSQPVEVSVVPQSVSKGMGNVPFKKIGIRKKKHNGRTTSADDD